MPKRANRSRRNTARSRMVQYSRTKVEVCLDVQDRNGSYTLTFRKCRDGQWCRTIKTEVPKIHGVTVGVKAPISHPHTDPNSRVGRGGTGNMSRQYRTRIEVPVYGQTTTRVQKFYYSESRLASIVERYGKTF